jgi:hypothetical protein
MFSSATELLAACFVQMQPDRQCATCQAGHTPVGVTNIEACTLYVFYVIRLPSSCPCRGFVLTSARLRVRHSDQMVSYPDATLSLGRLLYNLLYTVTSRDVNFCYPDRVPLTQFVHIAKIVFAICA